MHHGNAPMGPKHTLLFSLLMTSANRVNNLRVDNGAKADSGRYLHELTLVASRVPRRHQLSALCGDWLTAPMNQCSLVHSQSESPQPVLDHKGTTVKLCTGRKDHTIPFTSLGQVALHMSVWRSGRMRLIILLI